MTYVIKVNDPEILINYGFEKYGNAYYYEYGRDETGIEIIVKDKNLSIRTGRSKAPKKVLKLFKELYENNLIRFENAKDGIDITNIILVDEIKKEIEK